MSVAVALFRIVSGKKRKRAGRAERTGNGADVKKPALAAPVHSSLPGSIAARDAVMTGAGTWTAGADDTVAAAYLAAQRVGYSVAGSACIASDDVAIMAHFFARAAFLGLGQRAQREQYSQYSE
jgi:hypothetical protein